MYKIIYEIRLVLIKRTEAIRNILPLTLVMFRKYICEHCSFWSSTWYPLHNAPTIVEGETGAQKFRVGYDYLFNIKFSRVCTQMFPFVQCNKTNFYIVVHLMWKGFACCFLSLKVKEQLKSEAPSSVFVGDKISSTISNENQKFFEILFSDFFFVCYINTF